MKTIVAVVGCGIVAFIGMHLYLGSKRSAPAPVQTADATKAEETPKEEEQEEEAPRRKLKSRWSPRDVVRTEERPRTPERNPESAPKPKEGRTSGTKKPAASAAPYFVAQGPFHKGIPDRVILHN